MNCPTPLSGRFLLALALFTLSACSSSEEPALPAGCDAKCQDSVAARSLREVLKLVYNLTLQGNEVGSQDERTSCPHGGEARVTGDASSVPAQGSNDLELSFALDGCAYQRLDDEPEQSYHVAISGSVSERGTLAVQPTSTTALFFEADAVSISGDVYDPGVPYSESDCAVQLFQDGNHLSGTWCGRDVGVEL